MHYATAKCLNIEGGATGTSVIIYTCNATTQPNEVWQFSTLSDGRSQIQNAGLTGASGKCLNVYGGLRDVGTGTIVWPCASGGATNDTWYPQPTTKTIGIKVIKLANDDGSNASPMTSAQLVSGFNLVNQVYARAGISFDASHATWTTHNNTAMNGITNTACPGGVCTLDTAVRALVDTTKLTIILPNTGGGFSGMSASATARPTDYAKMPGDFTNLGGNPATNGTALGLANLLGHELGHYFNLDHTFFNPPSGTVLADDARTRLEAAAGNVVTAFDADGRDTFPDPGPWVFEERDGGVAFNSCAGSSTITVTPSTAAYAATLNVDRQNYMGYFACPFPSAPSVYSATLTPGQLAHAYSIATATRTHLP